MLLALQSMKKLIGTMLMVGFLSGCLIRTHNHGRGNGNSARRSGASCPPSQHWNGYECVHNGRARGHDKRR